MKYKIIIALLILAGTYYAGVKSVDVPEVVAIKAKIIDKDVKETTTTTKNKDGSVVIVKTKDTSVKSSTTSQVETKQAKSDRVHVQVMYGFDLTTVDQDRRAHYGLVVSKALLGPVTGGLFVLTDGRTTPVGGVTLGLEF